MGTIHIRFSLKTAHLQSAGLQPITSLHLNTHTQGPYHKQLLRFIFAITAKIKIIHLQQTHKSFVSRSLISILP